MATLLQPHVIVLAYWLIMIVLAGFFLRLACSLCRAGIPTWKRSIIPVLVVTFLAYLVFDYTCYLTMKTLDGDVIQMPRGIAITFRYLRGMATAYGSAKRSV
jgi:hypothetical protein